MLAGVAAGTSSLIPDLPIIRTRQGGEQRATFFELFFDLVYVFAVTQVSHHLLDDMSWAAAAETAFMLVALYWAWNYTTWMTNWFDPDTAPIRLVLVFVMAASLLMAVAIPEGFGQYALLFACGYAGLQIGRNAFVVAVTPRGRFNQNSARSWRGACSRRHCGSPAASSTTKGCAGFCGWRRSGSTSPGRSPRIGSRAPAPRR